MSVGYRYFVLFLLTASYTLNFVDRQIIAVISPQLKAELGLADWQLGLLKGFAFAVLYSMLSIPAARLADKWNRVGVISSAIAMWSAFTALSGMAHNFVQLLFARIGVGIGEAGGTAPAHALISEYFDASERGRALAIFALGVPVGVSLAYFVGGWIATHISWRVSLISLGVIGIILAAILALSVREKREPGHSETDKSEPFLKLLPNLLGKRDFAYLTIAVTCASFATYGIGAWIVDLFARVHPEFGLGRVYIALGLLNGIGYVAGTVLGGILVDRWSQENMRAYGYVPAAAVAITIPFFLFAIWCQSTVLSLAAWLPVHILLGVYLGPSFALVQSIAPANARAQAAAIFLLIINLVALGAGPTVLGVLSSAFQSMETEAGALQFAFSCLIIPLLLAIIGFSRLGRQASP